MNKKINKKNQYCHPELVSGSMVGSAWRVGNTLNGSCQRVNGFRTKSGMTDQSGRSMVEMLGVLAIIGVLSVGGISGYTTAMNKHKANEILNAAAVRAMVVSTQLQSGVTNPTLGEFPTGEEVGGATFGDVTKTGDKFKIGFSLTNEDVLTQIKNIAGTDGIVRGITGDGLIYNDDLTTGERASDFDGKGTGEGGCDTSKYTYCSESGRCLEGTNNPNCSQTCIGTAPTCKSACSENGAWVVSENDVDKPCKLSASSTENDGVCNADGACVAACNPACGTTYNNVQLACINGTCRCPDGQYLYTGKLADVWDVFQGSYCTPCTGRQMTKNETEKTCVCLKSFYSLDLETLDCMTVIE